MGRYTQYLTVCEESPDRFRVSITPHSPLPAIKAALAHSCDLRYSPILPAYLTPDEEPPSPSASPSSLAFFFAPNPYQVLGKMKPGLNAEERHNIFFTEGLASIVVLGFDAERIGHLKTEIDCSSVEIWSPKDGILTPRDVTFVQDTANLPTGSIPFDFTASGSAEIDVYVEQMSASIATLWHFYRLYLPSECTTLQRVILLVKSLVEQYLKLATGSRSLTTLKQQNAITSALVELSAALSYSVTQGASGRPPILANRSPFPHHSLLGVAGAVRAITNFTRYLEAAFTPRSASTLIDRLYSGKTALFPSSISSYESGAEYSFSLPPSEEEQFDSGGDFKTRDPVPLLAHFSLRHGFKEAKFSITAASESLGAECLAPWTLMTLSHEVMHARVRDIFQALFGTKWQDDSHEERWDTFFANFDAWYNAVSPSPVTMDQGIRNVVLNFCCATERIAEARSERRPETDRFIPRDELLSSFRKHKRLAVELFVHFHDFYFAYARQKELYVKSLWASWITVAAPVARPREYLVRTLATIACGSGEGPREAFEGAAELVEDCLAELEEAGTASPLFEVLRSMLAGESRERTFIEFKLAYYLLDQVRRYFASPLIAASIDRLDSDPFAGGSTLARDYSASLYVHGDASLGQAISPIRFSLAALVHQLSGSPIINDPQWLTAWNTMIICSQEATSC